MKTNEAIIKLLTVLREEYGNIIEPNKTRHLIESALDDYTIANKEKSLALVGDLREKIVVYLASKKLEGMSENTIKSYARLLKRFSNSVSKNVKDITPNDIRGFLLSYAQTAPKKSSLATASDYLRAFFSWLENEGYVEKSQMRTIKNIKVDKRLREGLTKEEYEIFFSNAETLREKALTAFLYSTGVRIEEAEKVNLSDINWNSLKLNVIGKGNKERTVFLNAQAKVHLKNYIKSRMDTNEALFAGIKKPFGRLGVRQMQREIADIAERAGLGKNVSPHILRHSIATHLLNSGMDITVLQQILGHEKIDTTMVYARISNDNIEHEFRKYS